MLEAVINNNSAPVGETSEIVRISTEAEKNQLIGTIALAFSTDPVARWLYPDPYEFLKHFPRFIEIFAGKAFENKSAYYTDDFGGAALWLPPDVHFDEDELIGFFEETLSAEVRADLYSILEQLDTYQPAESHWYLPMIGVDTYLQGNGYGSALMKYGLIACDSDKTSAYLESTNPANVPLYERFGFELLETVQAGSSPPLYPMVRKAKLDEF